MSETTTPAPAWVADLPEDLRGNQTLAQFKGEQWKDVGPVLAKSYVEARSVMGKKAYDLPQEDWKPEQWQSWHKTIGVPEGPDKYPAYDEKLAEKAGLTKEVTASAMKKFHELGLTPRQAKGLLNDWYLSEAANGADLQEKSRQEASAKAVADLKQQYGDKYDSRVALVKSALALGGGDLADRLEKAGFGNDPELFKALVAIGEKTLEDTTARGGKGVGGQDAKSAAAQEIGTLILDKEFQAALMNGMHPGHDAALQRWTRLHKIQTHGAV